MLSNLSLRPATLKRSANDTRLSHKSQRNINKTKNGVEVDSMLTCVNLGWQ